MNGQQLIAADLLLAAMSAAAWIASGVAMLSHRRYTPWLLATAGLVTLGRVAVVVTLAGHGRWFVQDKLFVTLPLTGVALLAALAVRKRPVAAVFVLAAGFAAVSGVLFQFLVGYAQSPAQYVVNSAFVALATAVTWRATTPRAGRQATAAIAAASAVGLAAVGLGFLPPPEVDTGGGPLATQVRHTVSVADLRGPDKPAPGGEVKRYELQARQAEITLASGLKVKAWTYNGQVPGPALTATEGDLVEVTLTNVDVTDGVTLHWHGYDVRNGEDGAPGVTQDEVLPGGRFVYRFLADQVGTYWYHTHQVSDVGVRLGLYGTLIVQPRKPLEVKEIVVPVHTFDGVLAIGTQDGVSQSPVPAGTRVRLRLLNTDSDPHRFTLTGTPFRVVAADGNDLNGPTEVAAVALRIAAGARYDLEFTMPSVSSGGTALLVDDGIAGLVLAGGERPDTSGWPELDPTAYGTPGSLAGHDAAPDREFTLVLDRGLSMVDGRPLYAHTVNGRAYPGIPAGLVREGDLVAFTVVNRGFDTHPWHLHGHRVMVLEKDGRAVSGSPLLLDTFDVRPGEVWRVAFRADNPGIWMNHCHNLSHADQGMALHLAYAGVTGENMTHAHR